MYVLNYWHTVSDYAECKKIFDSDPLGRTRRRTPSAASSDPWTTSAR